MGETTKIEWADHTFNPWIGCQKVGPGCDHCYAEGMDHRFGGGHWGPHAERKRTSVANWRLPFRWNDQAAAAGRRPFVFCASLADVFDNQVNPGWRRDLFDVIDRTRHLVWLLLTKRPQNINGMVTVLGHWPPNIALGCTVVNQAEADRDIPVLLNSPKAGGALFYFVSIEPQLGPIDVSRYLRPRSAPHADGYGGREGPGFTTNFAQLSWVICGGESGPAARPMHPAWARSLRDQCAAAGVPFLFKQWGVWSPRPRADAAASVICSDGQVLEGQRVLDRADDAHAEIMFRVGKHRAGRDLDGDEFSARPIVPAIERGHLL
jgi:protein gp37